MSRAFVVLEFRGSTTVQQIPIRLELGLKIDGEKKE